MTASATIAMAQASSGWIDFTPSTNLGIYLPVTVNGQPAMALLYGGPTTVDTSFAGSATGGLEVRLGDLTLHPTAKPGDLRTLAYVSKIFGTPVPLLLGEDVFDQFAVDIDFAHHRVALLDPNTVRKPAGAIEVPITAVAGERVVPLSIDGAAPAQFELELGNVIGPLLVSPVYARSHHLLDGHPTSQRLSGPFIETVVSLAHLRFAGVDFPGAPIALIPETQVPPDGITGGVGLPLLSKFRLIVDYPHNRLFAIPDAAALQAPIAKDRIGLLLDRKDTNGLSVAFVSPNSPAEAAGFKKGDTITLIDGKPFAAWPVQAIIKFHMADAGTTHTFTMPDGALRQVKAADFF
jgi:PDZ domain